MSTSQDDSIKAVEARALAQQAKPEAAEEAAPTYSGEPSTASGAAEEQTRGIQSVTKELPSYDELVQDGLITPEGTIRPIGDARGQQAAARDPKGNYFALCFRLCELTKDLLVKVVDE